jgi:hypothetical protein
MAARKKRVAMVEGVPWYPHVVRFTLADGRRRRWVRWSPGHHWVYGEVARELQDRFGYSGVKERSCTIRLSCDTR